MPTTPLWPTTVRSRSKDGRIRGTDGSVWLYRSVPMAPVADARSPDEGLVVGEPLRIVLNDISSATAVRVPRRSLAKSAYRDLHVLLINIPVRFTPPRGSQLAGYVTAAFGDEAVDRRLLVVGVKLRDQIGGGDHGLSKAVDSVVQTISTGVAPLSDFDADFALIDGIMARAGLTAMTPDDYRVANAWWNHGYSPDAPLLVHTDHIHVFGSSDSARMAASLVERDGDAACGTWNFADHHTVSFGCVQDFDLPYVDEDSSAAQWVSSLIEAGAVCVSHRGKLEPPQVTRAELRRRKKQAIDDETERASQNKMSRSELDERLSELDQMEAVYAIGGPPVLVEASTVVAFTGFDERSGYDMREMGLGHGVLLSTMTARQNTAMAETWLASNVRAVPYLHDIPAHTLAASGLPNLSTVGDRDGALVGFTERDHQPSYLTAMASSDSDALPIFVGAGATGSGKAVTLSTRIPDPWGWTTMGELRIGQTIFDGDGGQCKVTAIYDHQDLVLYDVHFSDGQVVRACKDHLWAVSTATEQVSKTATRQILVMSTQDLINYKEDAKFAVAVPGPIECDHAVLPIDPHAFGVWIGEDASIERAQKTGDQCIPKTYLRADEAQRLELLQGIMDAAGTIDETGSCELTLGNERTARDSLELIRSLGVKAALQSGDCHKISFTTTKPVFRTPQKLLFIPTVISDDHRWNTIADITPAPSAPGRCITVDSDEHTYLVEEFIPTHNTMLMQFLADQFSRQTNKHNQRRPVVVIDPKVGSTLAPVVLGAGGRVASLDELTSSDGVFDPMRFSSRKEVGVELSASMLMSINPWGTGKLDYETPLIKALSYGADKGADCTGIALKIALGDGQAPKDMVDRVFDLAGASPMFRACVGLQAGGPRLQSAEGITLIKVGQAYLDLPEPGATESATQQQRIALALVRMMVYGSAMALTGRQGVLMLDEAWVMLSAGRSEVERLGRMARSQEVLPMLFTQRVTDATNAGLSGYIARGVVLPIEDRTEAEAACELFRLEPTPERIARITAKATLGGVGAAGGGAPNWSSMRALRDPSTGTVIRGAVGIYIDLSGRAVPVEIKIPGEFLERASTNPEDIRRRLAAAEAARTTG